MVVPCTLYTTTAGRADLEECHQERSFQPEDQLLCKQPPLPYKYAAGCDESEDKSGSYLVWRPSAAQLERSKRGKNAAQENTKSREDDAFLKFLPKDRDLKTMIGIISIFYCYGLS